MDNEVMLDTSNLEAMMGELIQSIDKLDLSIDYLSAIMSGDEAAIIGAAQGAFGRAVGARNLSMPAAEGAMVENKRVNKLFENKIRSIIGQEVVKFLKNNK
tara:strand:- start:33 stop:335 length:303 start_codon:yes stop_codon:yes gene_type:complete